MKKRKKSRTLRLEKLAARQMMAADVEAAGDARRDIYAGLAGGSPAPVVDSANAGTTMTIPDVGETRPAAAVPSSDGAMARAADEIALAFAQLNDSDPPPATSHSTQIQVSFNGAGERVTDFTESGLLYRRDTERLNGSLIQELWDGASTQVTTHYTADGIPFFKETVHPDRTKEIAGLTDDSAVLTRYTDGQVSEQSVWKSEGRSTVQTWDSSGGSVKTFYVDDQITERRTWSDSDQFVVETWTSDGLQITTSYKAEAPTLRETLENGELTKKEEWTTEKGTSRYVVTTFVAGAAQEKWTYADRELSLHEQWKDGQYIRSKLESGELTERDTHTDSDNQRHLILKERWSADSFVKTQYKGSGVVTRDTFTKKDGEFRLTRHEEINAIKHGTTVTTYIKDDKAYRRDTRDRGKLVKREDWKTGGVFLSSTYKSDRIASRQSFRDGALVTNIEWKWHQIKPGEYKSSKTVSTFEKGTNVRKDSFDINGVLRQRIAWNSKGSTKTVWNSKKQETLRQVFNAKKDLVTSVKTEWKRYRSGKSYKWHKSKTTTSHLTDNVQKRVEVRSFANHKDKKGTIVQKQEWKKGDRYVITKYSSSGSLMSRQTTEANGSSKLEEWKSKGVKVVSQYNRSQRLESRTTTTKNKLTREESWTYKKVGGKFQVATHVREDYSKEKLVRRTTMKSGKLYRVEEWKRTYRMTWKSMKLRKTYGTQKTSTYFSNDQATKRYTYFSGKKEKFEQWKSGKTTIIHKYNRSTGKRFERLTIVNRQQTKKEQWMTDGRRVNTYFGSDGKVNRRYTYSSDLKISENWRSDGAYIKWYFANQPTITGATNYVEFYREWWTKSNKYGNRSTPIPSVAFSFTATNNPVVNSVKKAAKTSGVNKLGSVPVNKYLTQPHKIRWDKAWKSIAGSIGVPQWLRTGLAKLISPSSLSKAIKLPTVKISVPKVTLANVTAGFKFGAKDFAAKAAPLKDFGSIATKAFQNPLANVSLGDLGKLDFSKVASLPSMADLTNGFDVSFADAKHGLNVTLGDFSDWGKDRLDIADQFIKDPLGTFVGGGMYYGEKIGEVLFGEPRAPRDARWENLLSLGYSQDQARLITQLVYSDQGLQGAFKQEFESLLNEAVQSGFQAHFSSKSIGREDLSHSDTLASAREAATASLLDRYGLNPDGTIKQGAKSRFTLTSENPENFPVEVTPAGDILVTDQAGNDQRIGKIDDMDKAAASDFLDFRPDGKVYDDQGNSIGNHDRGEKQPKPPGADIPEPEYDAAVPADNSVQSLAEAKASIKASFAPELTEATKTIADSFWKTQGDKLSGLYDGFSEALEHTGSFAEGFGDGAVSAVKDLGSAVVSLFDADTWVSLGNTLAESGRATKFYASEFMDSTDKTAFLKDFGQTALDFVDASVEEVAVDFLVEWNKADSNERSRMIGKFAGTVFVDAVVEAAGAGVYRRLKQLPSKRDKTPDIDGKKTQEAVDEIAETDAFKSLDEAVGSMAKSAGISREAAVEFQKIADLHEVTIKVRPRSERVLEKLDSGEVHPKPLSIKSKTINEVDIELGANDAALDLAAIFDPRETVRRKHNLADQAEVDQWLQNQSPEVRDRFRNRLDDYNDNLADLEADPGHYIDDDGVIRIADGINFEHAYVGDSDLFAILDAKTGESLKELDPKRYRKVIKKLSEAPDGSNAKHGAIEDLKPENISDKKKRDQARETKEAIIPTHDSSLGGTKKLAVFSPYEGPTMKFSNDP